MDQNDDPMINSIIKDQEEEEIKKYAKSLGSPYINLSGISIPPEILNIIAKESALKFKIIPYGKEKNFLKITTPTPQESATQRFISDFGKSRPLMVSVCSKSSFESAFRQYDQIKEKAKEEKIEITKEQEVDLEGEITNLTDLKEKINKVPITKILDIIFAGAVKTEASDIHLEPYEQEFKIRFRIDGILQEVAILPIKNYKPLLSRIKFLAKMKLDIGSAQDGRFQIKVLDRSIDIRANALPTSYGQAMEMRLLYETKKFISLDKLGFRPELLKDIEEAISKPHGMVLNTGPTGCGKTTTMYAIIARLNKSGIKIITLEDPIEYRIKGVDQVQVNPEKKMTFAEGLKSLLRHDPDIMMVGEIRDLDTAQTALQAALTGHLLLSTLHTNNAAAAIPRLIDMGVEAFLLSGSINLIIAQRLVRLLCKKCLGKGCPSCMNTGYKGRIAIAEALKPTSEINKLIARKAPLSEFDETVKKMGVITMEQDGMQKVAQGLTTKEEVLRVTKE